MFRVLVESGVLERINALPKNEADNLKRRLKALESDPFPDGRDKKEIKGSRRTAYRLRADNYRFFYVIEKENRIAKITEFMTAEQAHKKYGRL